jgi:hypothetical protein
VPVEDWPLERHPYPQESSIPGVFVAGDVRAGATGGITVAFGEGTQAFQWIKREFLPGLAVTPAREEALLLAQTLAEKFDKEVELTVRVKALFGPPDPLFRVVRECDGSVSTYRL